MIAGITGLVGRFRLNAAGGNTSLMTLARGAKQLVVHEALEMTWYSDL